MTHEQIAAMVNRLKLAKITGCRAAYALLGATPLDKINADIAAAADLIEAQAAELATLRAERDGSAGVRIQDIAQYLLDHLPSYADHPAWDAMQDAVDDGLDEDDCIRAWLRALAKIGGAA